VCENAVFVLPITAPFSFTVPATDVPAESVAAKVTVTGRLTGTGWGVTLTVSR
jgi:hypothetical protein